MSSLDTAYKGSKFIIERLPDGNEKMQFIRMGVCEGDTLACIYRLPGGKMVVQRNRQEIAIGSFLAKKIQISLI